MSETAASHEIADVNTRPLGPSDAYCRAAWSAVCTSQAVIEFDTNGIITWANVGFLKLVRYQLSDLVGQHHRVLCYPEQTKTEEYRRLWKSLGDGRFDSGEYARRRSDGSEIWLQATYNPVFDEDGSVQRVIKIATDVTRRVALEQSAKIHLDNETAMKLSLQERGEELHQAVEALAEIVEHISRLADASKLLALNASIEAARSGDAGRGFAVVAGEVHKLANDTRMATKRADTLIAEQGRRRDP